MRVTNLKISLIRHVYPYIYLLFIYSLFPMKYVPPNIIDMTAPHDCQHDGEKKNH